MGKRLIAAIFIAYSVLLIDIMVFRFIPVIRIGHLRFNLGGADANGRANFVPFKTILSYLHGGAGVVIGIINLVGNVALLFPIGFLAPFIFRTMSWKKSLVLAIAAGFAIEGTQVLFHTGIFDIDDVILNALGVMIGYGAYVMCVKVKARIRGPVLN